MGGITSGDGVCADIASPVSGFSFLGSLLLGLLSQAPVLPGPYELLDLSAFTHLSVHPRQRSSGRGNHPLLWVHPACSANFSHTLTNLELLFTSSSCYSEINSLRIKTVSCTTLYLQYLVQCLAKILCAWLSETGCIPFEWKNRMLKALSERTGFVGHQFKRKCEIQLFIGRCGSYSQTYVC